ncbi:MAG TPA: GTP diphosphokinase [Gammaproteobacteria bacterium]|nr:GTP diphosphokinase [Gammaproteobacteria bacterium]
MVSIKHSQSALTSKDTLDLSQWLAGMGRRYGDKEMVLIRRACALAEKAHAGQYRASGEPYVQHALAVAHIVAELQLDHETVAAAILHDVVEDSDIGLEDIRREFGDAIASLVEGVTKMKLIQAFQSLPEKDKKERLQAENLRKMLLAMAEDIRVVLIKLADRTHNMRTLAALPEDKRRRIARETLDIYAPLANRLGIWQIKWELEDLSLRYLNPPLYKKIARMLDERRIDRERYIQNFIRILQRELDRAGVKAEITGRPKHIYSIWRKMERKNLDYHQIYDVRGVRILVNTVHECYTALGVVHSLWQYIAGEFDDYIATPKENNYQSIHTAVIGPEGKTVEVQIRTHEMHRRNELGVAAHWRYKEGSGHDDDFDRRIAWLRQLLEWKDEVADAGDFVDQFKSEVFQDRIYVFTPRGNVVDLPAGATPLDFAYHIHTEVGHRCRGAKVNGRMVPLTYTLRTGEQVEILTVKSATPSRDWLNPHLGYLKTSRARSKVLTWFRHQDREKNIQAGRAMLERELRRVGLSGVNLDRLAEKLGYGNSEDLFIAVAHSEIKAARYLTAAQEQSAPVASGGELPQPRPRESGHREEGGDVRIQGIGNLLTHMARCCKPVPGDDIRGYITQGRGVTIHRSDCANILRYASRTPERVIEVDWGEEGRQTYPVDVQITAIDRHGLLRDITAVLANDRINLLAAQTRSDHRRHLAQMELTLEIADIDALSRVLARINQLPNVMEAKRISH